MSYLTSITSPARSAASGWSKLLARDEPLITDARFRIYLASFTLLFFELAVHPLDPLLRPLPELLQQLHPDGLVPGHGLGISRRRRPALLVPALPGDAAAAGRSWSRSTASTCTSPPPSVLYFGAGAGAGGAAPEHFIVLPIIFGLVTAQLHPARRPLGRLFDQVKPLTAYTFDIVGSLAGIAASS